jgi:hypothetical protein
MMRGEVTELEGGKETRTNANYFLLFQLFSSDEVSELLRSLEAQQIKILK